MCFTSMLSVICSFSAVSASTPLLRPPLNTLVPSAISALPKSPWSSCLRLALSLWCSWSPTEGDTIPPNVGLRGVVSLESPAAYAMLALPTCLRFARWKPPLSQGLAPSSMIRSPPMSIFVRSTESTCVLNNCNKQPSVTVDMYLLNK
ncbi:hypothetical protein NP493_361g02021 [Ridgeia piscesae]|uniref:Secreted protein n=1 Tax=Ridgeia piscesae TaxID=27915 RepID=A0AAD9L2V7_RIDPI|nr:hypothetical protein NP493_361g02021 [Ridgeia piscesae]